MLKLPHEGFTIAEIADELRYRPATIAKWIPAADRLRHVRVRRVRGARFAVAMRAGMIVICMAIHCSPWSGMLQRAAGRCGTSRVQ